MSSTSSNAPPSYGDLLDDEALAPLKRNHACLQCKKRKVKCDGTRPSCAPCLRSHAHALRSAQRNSSTPPILTCTYTEVETPDSRGNSPPSDPLRSVNETEQRKRRGAKRHHEDGDSEEKAALLAKITELEQQLAALRPLASLSEKSSLKQTYSGGGNIWSNEPVSFIDNQQNWDGGIPPLALPPVDPTGFENLFLVPTGWPRNLPSPFLLEHLVETFFTHVPQLPRMLHRASFLPRIQLPPTNPNFPDAALLHAICARASLHTAWVNSIPPEQVESVIERHKAINNDLEGLDDFGLSQVEAARRCIHLAFTTCDMAGGPRLLEQCMAGVIIADVYFSKGVPMLGWEAAGVPGRMVRVLELNNRNLPKERHKDALLSPPVDSIEREARLGLLWNAFLADSGFALNGGWGRSFELSDMRTQLPGSECDFQKGVYVEENPQNAQSPDLYNNHPVQDPFVLSIKAAVLSCRASRWLHFWQQRDIIPGDDMTGLRHPDFLTLVHDLHDFKRTVPDAVKNLFKICEVQGPQALDADVLTIHILPNLSLALLYEPFVQTQNAETDDALYKIRRACDSIIGILHLIPTNLDVATIMTPVIGFSLYSVGRLIANDIQRLMSASKFEQALKVRGDLSTVQAMLGRYGQQHALGLAMVNFLDHYLSMSRSSPLTAQDLAIVKQYKQSTTQLPQYTQTSSNTSFNSNLSGETYDFSFAFTSATNPGSISYTPASASGSASICCASPGQGSTPASLSGFSGTCSNTNRSGSLSGVSGQLGNCTSTSNQQNCGSTTTNSNSISMDPSPNSHSNSSNHTPEVKPLSPGIGIRDFNDFLRNSNPNDDGLLFPLNVAPDHPNYRSSQGIGGTGTEFNQLEERNHSGVWEAMGAPRNVAPILQDMLVRATQEGNRGGGGVGDGNTGTTGNTGNYLRPSAFGIQGVQNWGQ